jgi:hypothetical protein
MVSLTSSVLHSSAKYISAPALPIQMEDLFLTQLLPQKVHPYKIDCIPHDFGVFRHFLLNFRS